MKKYKIILPILLLLIILSIATLYILQNNRVISTYDKPIIPEGFEKVETDTASWKLDENEKVIGWNDGLVIEDEIGNQFVWVPVDNQNIKYERKNTYSKYLPYNLPDGVKDVSKQIEKYGGFYIARYEAGVSDEMQSINTNISAETNNIEGIPVSKKDVRPWNSIHYRQAKSNAELMYNTKNLKSGLVNCIQWDAIMQWIENSGLDVSEESSSWGNYANSWFNFNGLYSIDYGKTYNYATDKMKETYNMILSSGASDRNMAKNIYDLAGNLQEWTIDISDENYYTIRGGYFDYSGSFFASSSQHIKYGYLEWQIGFRVVLHLK